MKPAGDPKQNIKVANLLHDAMLDVQDSRYEEAIPGLERVIAQQPTIAIAHLQPGIARASLKEYDKGITPLKTAVEILPDSGLSHYSWHTPTNNSAVWPKLKERKRGHRQLQSDAASHQRDLSHSPGCSGPY